MAVEVDYYAVLGVDRQADKDGVEAAVKKSMREWRKRTEAADLSVRQEAELKVKLIEEARTTLLDPARRSKYDQDLAGGVKQAPISTPAPAGSGERWLDRAEGYLAVGDYHSAAYAAREATQQEGANARTWLVRSRAHAGLKQWQDALYEARQAAQLEENNAEYHFHFGLVHEEMAQFGDAITEFRRAATCDPSNPTYELAVGGVFLSNGRVAEALSIVEAVYAKHPQDANANYYLGMTLLEVAEKIPAKREGDTYFVSSENEIHQMRALAVRVKNLTIVDDGIKQHADRILAYLARMEEKAWRPPLALLSKLFKTNDDFLDKIVKSLLVAAVAFLPVILFFAGLSSITSDPGSGFLMMLIGGGLGYLWYKQSYVPRWKHNQRTA